MFVHTGMLYQKWTQNYKQTLSNLETDLAADILISKNSKIRK